LSRELRRELRKAKRVHRRQAAWVVLDGGCTQLPCVLWDISEGGARIAAARASALPDTFGLFLTKDGKSRRFCRVAWRRGGYLGVQFVDEATANIDLDRRPAWMRRKPADLPAVASAASAQDIDASQLLLPGYGADLALEEAPQVIRWSVLARFMLLLLVAATAVFIVAGIEYAAAWSVAICSKAENFCRHPEWTGGAAIVMLLIYLAISGMED
jgi:hypothetical protein